MVGSGLHHRAQRANRRGKLDGADGLQVEGEACERQRTISTVHCMLVG